MGLRLRSAGVTVTDKRTLQRSPVDEEPKATRLPVAAGLARVTATLVQVMRGVHGRFRRQDDAGQAGLTRIRFGAVHELAGDPGAARALGNGEHPNLGLVWS